MPVNITIDAQLRRIHTRISGRITVATLRDYYRDLYAHPLFEPAMSELFDVSDVTAIELTAADVRDFSTTTAPNTRKGEGVRVAILAPTDLAFGLARLYELTQVDSSNQLRVVRTADEAEVWLDGAPVHGAS